MQRMTSLRSIWSKFSSSLACRNWCFLYGMEITDAKLGWIVLAVFTKLRHFGTIQLIPLFLIPKTASALSCKWCTTSTNMILYHFVLSCNYFKLMILYWYLNFSSSFVHQFPFLFCRHTEDSHVKTNLAHNLFRICLNGLMSLEVLSAANIRKCKQS